MTDGHARPGWGSRDPSLAALLRDAAPLASTMVHWGERRELPIRVCGHLGVPTLPDELVSSIRCLVRAEDRIVLCTNEHETHPWPGGRREDGETWEATAVREVHEETGWILDENSLVPYGWLHFEYLTPRPADWPYPHPDFLQVVYLGLGTARRTDEQGSWTDLEGWERTSRLATMPEALDAVSDEIAVAFLRTLDT